SVQRRGPPRPARSHQRPRPLSKLARRLARSRTVLATVVANDGRLPFAERREAHRPLPHAHERAQRLLRVVAAKIDPLMLVAQEKLAAVLVIRVFDVDERIAGVRQLKEQLVFDLLELARHDLEPLVAIGPREAEELVIAAELGREKLVDEGDVAIKRTHFENL